MVSEGSSASALGALLGRALCLSEGDLGSLILHHISFKMPVCSSALLPSGMCCPVQRRAQGLLAYEFRIGLEQDRELWNKTACGVTLQQLQAGSADVLQTRTQPLHQE